jgi:hypothetical protein
MEVHLQESPPSAALLSRFALTAAMEHCMATANGRLLLMHSSMMAMPCLSSTLTFLHILFALIVSGVTEGRSAASLPVQANVRRRFHLSTLLTIDCSARTSSAVTVGGVDFCSDWLFWESLKDSFGSAGTPQNRLLCTRTSMRQTRTSPPTIHTNRGTCLLLAWAEGVRWCSIENMGAQKCWARRVTFCGPMDIVFFR